MANQNGLLILETLKDMKEPATLANIATQIANSAGATLEDIRDTVKATLDGGVQYGFVQKKGRKYYAATAQQELEDDEDKGSEELQDENAVGRRRRRRRRRSTSRSSSRGSRRRSRSRRGGR